MASSRLRSVPQRRKRPLPPVRVQKNTKRKKAPPMRTVRLRSVARLKTGAEIGEDHKLWSEQTSKLYTLRSRSPSKNRKNQKLRLEKYQLSCLLFIFILLDL